MHIVEIILKLTKEYLAYVAGFFDGEGSVSIAHIKVSGQYYLAVRVVKNIEKVIRDIATNFGFENVVYRDKDYPQLNAKRPNWRLILGNKKAYNFLKAIYPYLIVKRKQAEIGIKFQEMLHSDLDSAVKNKLKEEFKAEIQAVTASKEWVA